MATTRVIRAYGPDDAPPPRKRPTTVLAAAEEGDLLGEMRAMRLVIAKKLDDPNLSGRDMAALSKRHIEIAREIDAVMRQQAEEAENGAVTADEAWSKEAI